MRRSKRFKKAYEVLNTYKQLTLVNHLMFLLVKLLLLAIGKQPTWLLFRCKKCREYERLAGPVRDITCQVWIYDSEARLSTFSHFRRIYGLNPHSTYH
jgi:hypothetical protein